MAVSEKTTEIATKRNRGRSKVLRIIRPSSLKKVAKSLNPLRFITFAWKQTRRIHRLAQESFAELKNVTWLSKKDTFRFGIWIIAFIVFGATIVALLDLGFFRLIGLLTTR